MKPRRDVVVQQVVHDAVAEVSRPNLAWLGPGDDKADRAAGLVVAADQLVMQLAQVAFQAGLERDGAGAVALVAPAVDEGGHQLLEQVCICGRLGRGRHSSCRCCSGCRCWSSGSRHTSCCRAIYVTLPKAVADQRGNCAGPGLRSGSGLRGAHGGGLVGQRRDQIQIAHGHEGLDRHAAGALFVADLIQPPPCLPMLSSSATESAQSLCDT